MKKLNVAIIGQGRSGKDIHGLYFRSESNAYFDVKYVVDLDAHRRSVSEDIYPGCRTFSDYTELFDIEDIDFVVYCTYSTLHFITLSPRICSCTAKTSSLKNTLRERAMSAMS